MGSLYIRRGHRFGICGYGFNELAGYILRVRRLKSNVLCLVKKLHKRTFLNINNIILKTYCFENT